jgi:hypothetical protein
MGCMRGGRDWTIRDYGGGEGVLGILVCLVEVFLGGKPGMKVGGLRRLGVVEEGGGRGVEEGRLDNEKWRQAAA